MDSLPAPADALENPSSAALQEAAEWYAVLRAGQASPQERSNWQVWLDACDEHRAAWRQVEEISRGFRALQATPDPQQTSDSLLQATARFRRRRRTLAGLAALAGGGLAAGLAWRQGGLRASVQAWAADYRTAVGAQNDVVLADGSRIWLDTASAFDVDYGPALRRIVLVAGQIFVATARDAARPFVVDTRQGRMTALGTRFNVRQEGEQTLLAVYEGAVQARPAAGAAVIVPAGRQAGFTRERIVGTGPADPARQAWTEGMVLVRDALLRDVVRELGRYYAGHLGVADEVAGLKVYGSFPARDTGRALAMLAAILPIRLVRRLPWWIEIEARR